MGQRVRDSEETSTEKTSDREDEASVEAMKRSEGRRDGQTSGKDSESSGGDKRTWARVNKCTEMNKKTWHALGNVMRPINTICDGVMQSPHDQNREGHQKCLVPDHNRLPNLFC